MRSLGITHVPALADGDRLMNMREALQFLNTKGGRHED